MKADALVQQLGEIGPGRVFLVPGEAKRLGARDARGDVAGDFLGFLAMRREDEDGAEIVAQRTGDAARPVAGDGLGDIPRERIDFNFVEGDGALALLDEGDVATAVEPFEPVADRAGIGDAAAEEEELRRGRHGEDGALVVIAAHGIAEPLVLVDDVERGAVGCLLGLERGDHERSVGSVGEVAGGDADVPALAGPLGEFVVGQRAGRDSKDDLAGTAALLEVLLEDESLARAGWGLDNDVVARCERADGLPLPRVREAELLEGFEGGH